MTVTETRKAELTKIYGSANCVTGQSWMKAAKDDLMDTGKIYSDDIQFLHDTPGWCVPKTTTVTSGAKITELNGVVASIYEGTTLKGETGQNIELSTGSHALTIKKEGYIDKEITIAVTSGAITSASVALEKTETTTPAEEEPPVETTTGLPVIVPTGNKKFPYSITPGADNWFAMEYRNDGTASWRGYLGIRLLKDGEEIFKWTGDPTKAQIIAAGETEYIWCKVAIPDTVQTGKVMVSILRYTA